MAETDTSGNTTNEYIYFAGMRIARRDASANVFYYFDDHLGTPRKITNSAGTVCYDADFYPFGGERLFTNTCAQNYKFAAMERDTETGEDHTWFRQYSSNLGRWLSPDSLRGHQLNPQSWNRYAYVLNGPTALSDTRGLTPRGPLYKPVALPCELSCGGGGGGTVIFGNDILDAISGAPGTYLTQDMYGNVGFGFSIDLYNQTQNYIDSWRTTFAAGGGDYSPRDVPTTGYGVVTQDFGTFVQTTGLIPEMNALSQERLQLASMLGWASYYTEAVNRMGGGMEAEDQALRNTIMTAGQQLTQDEWDQMKPYIDSFAMQWNAFLNYQNTFLGL